MLMHSGGKFDLFLYLFHPWRGVGGRTSKVISDPMGAFFDRATWEACSLPIPRVWVVRPFCPDGFGRGISTQSELLCVCRGIVDEFGGAGFGAERG